MGRWARYLRGGGMGRLPSRGLAAALAFAVGSGLTFVAWRLARDAEATLKQVVLNLHAAIAESGAEVTHDPLPTLRGDESLLVQLLQNLVANAVKFRRTEPPRIHISAARRGQEWFFCVRDNGIGIESRHAQQIFRIFRRLHDRHSYPGTGIGLAMCRRIAEYHGGRIWVESVPGQGSTFCFTLPLIPGAQANESDHGASG